MNYLQQFCILKEKYPPKLICKAITRDTELWAHICKETSQYTDLSVPERVYLWAHRISPYCQHNSKKSFNTLEKDIDSFADQETNASVVKSITLKSLRRIGKNKIRLLLLLDLKKCGKQTSSVTAKRTQQKLRKLKTKPKPLI